MLQIVKYHQHSHLQIHVPEVTDKIKFVFQNVKKTNSTKQRWQSNRPFESYFIQKDGIRSWKLLPYYN